MRSALQIEVSKGIFKDKPVVYIDFEFRWDIVDRMKKIPGATYISSKKFWYINESEFDLKQFKTEILALYLNNTIRKLPNVFGYRTI